MGLQPHAIWGCSLTQPARPCVVRSTAETAHLPYISPISPLSPLYLPVRSTAETAALVGAAELALLPPRAVLVNVAQPVERAVLLAPPPHHLWSRAPHSPGDIGEM